MITITELIKSQVYEVLFMFSAGIAFMIFYEIFCFVKHKAMPKKIGSFVMELLFWFAASLLTSAFLYKCAYGRLSFHAFCAFVFGALLWKKIFYGIIDSGESECLKEKLVEAESSKKTTR